ncbi:hypothetical protein BN2476_480004 [Paraburkholderia piptadeniae]|uniref:Uncharacterized protein n=1 Tax=Paraburkholderia piptadeniae TaxID=1701573 RepID=A0A1N7SFN4_9BURK|nr:hypothetical protein BN2476_480004 [Paraburkholderia piptadeniae]
MNVASQLIGSNGQPRAPVISLRAQAARAPVVSVVTVAAGYYWFQPESVVRTSGPDQKSGPLKGFALLPALPLSGIWVSV